jgi:phage tail-like protein
VAIPVTSTRYDPYKNFKFRVKWDGRYVAGISRVGELSRTTDVIEHRAGGDPSTTYKSPGITRYEAIRLERGVSHDAEFARWANKAWYVLGKPGAESSGDFRKDILIEVYNEVGQKVATFNVYRCWISEFRALSELDASGSAVVFESITLQNEGWLRDYDSPPPEPPNFDAPAA